MAKKLNTTLSAFERQTLVDICKDNDCDMSTLIDALMNNAVSEIVSAQIHYIKTGELPTY